MSAHAPRSRVPREIHIDAFRGLMALAMVQGHVCDTLLSEALRNGAVYRFQAIFHGSTAPGFLFASGFVAGLPRAPLSWRAGLRRARRLLFVLAVGYFLHLPYFSFWKTRDATAVELAALYACDALQAIAVTQLSVLGLQLMLGRRWTLAAGLLAALVLGVGPWLWASGVSARVHPLLGAYLDMTRGSHFPLFPFSAFVLAGTVAGALVGRQEPARRHRRAVQYGLGLIGAGLVLTWWLSGKVGFWGVSPAYALLRLGGLLLLLRAVEAATGAGWRLIPTLALFGRESLQVFVLHLLVLYGGVVVTSPLSAQAGRLGWPATLAVLGMMVPLLYAGAWTWHRFKVHFPHEATLALAFLAVAFLFEFFTRPW